MTDLLSPLPAHAGAACYPGHVGDPCSHVPTCGDKPPAVHAGPPHRTRRNHVRPVAAIHLARPAAAGPAIPSEGSSNEDQARREGGQAETKASGRQGQR